MATAGDVGPDLADLIKRVMDERRVTARDIARITGIPESTLGSWKRRSRATAHGPSPAMLRQFADGLGLSVAEVFRAAGRVLPWDGGQAKSDEQSMLHLWRELTDDEREMTRAIMLTYRNRRQAEKAMDDSSEPPSGTG